MQLAKVLVITLALGLGSSIASAQNTSTDTVRSRVPGDGAVKGDTQPKPSANGQKATDYHPAVKTKPAAAPPAPVVEKPKAKKDPK